MPDDWRIVRIDQQFTIQQGKQVSERHREGDRQRPFLRTKNVYWDRLDLTELDAMHFSAQEEARLRLLPDDLLTCEGGWVGRTAKWNDGPADCLYQNHLHRLRRISEDTDPHFALYWLWYAFEIGQVYFGRQNITTIPNLSKSRLGELPMPAPEAEEQRRISQVLSAVQRAIERQERLIALTAELKKALMHKLFTEGTRGEPLKQTEIGPVPESWNLVPLGTLFSREPANGLYLPQSKYGSGIPILRIDDFSNDGDIVSSARNRVEATDDDQRRFGLSKDDIVVNRVNSLSHLGKTALIGDLSEAMLFESNMMRFRVDENRLRPPFAFRVLNSPIGKSQIVGLAKRAVAQSSVNQGDVSRLMIPLPPEIEEQDVILSVIDAAEAKLKNHTEVRGTFAALFRTLLHQLMTAQVRVHNLDLVALDEPAAESAGVN